MTYPNPYQSTYDPNVGIAQDATARVNALKSRLAGMADQDAGTNDVLMSAYRKQLQQQQMQQQYGGNPQGSNGNYQLPPSQQPTGQLSDWINQALQKTGLGSEYASGVYNIIKHESGGRPNAINRWDSNWQAGHPSEGLMQTIAPTFRRWALPGYNTNIYDPVSNIIAGIRYAQNRYGNGMLLAGGRRGSHGQYIGY